MNYILAFLIFSGVIATGNALKCVTCKVVEDEADNCTGDIEECDENTYKCATQIEYNELNCDMITSVRKRCLPIKFKDYCGNRFKLDSKGFMLSVYTQCCNDTDGCNTNTIQMPEEATTPNGRICPICFAEGSDKCTPTETKACVGNQLQCMNFSGPAARPEQDVKDYAIQGCITQNSCMLDFGGLPATCVLSDKYKCTTP